MPQDNKLLVTDEEATKQAAQESYCECGHRIWCELWREGEHLGTLVFFDYEETSETYSELVTRCPGCAEQLAKCILAPNKKGRPTAVTEDVPKRPTLAPNIELVGELQGSGFKDPQWLIQRSDRFIQVTEILYRVAEQMDGEHTLEEIAEGVTESTEWMVSTDNVRQIIQDKLIPLGLVTTVSNSSDLSHDGEHSGTRSSLSVNLRAQVIGPHIIDPITKVLQVLFAPLVLIPTLIAIVFAHGWLYSMHGITQSLTETFSKPALLLTLMAFIVVSIIFHEFGHAAALRYGGGKVRGMGVGVYLTFPVLYTDTTDNYRLGRWARVRTDLGGFYFHLIFALGLIALYLATGWEFLLFGVVAINIDIVFQCLPFVRFDGYWALADLTGIPDFFSQMGAFLRSLLPAFLRRLLPIPQLKGSKLPSLKPWVKAVFVAYSIITIPLLGWLLFGLVSNLPSTIVTIGSSFYQQALAFNYALDKGSFSSAGLSIVQAILLAVEMVGLLLILYALVQKPIKAIWNWSKPTPMRRIAGALVALGVIALLAVLWAL